MAPRVVRLAAIAAAAAALSACLKVDVPEDAFFWPESRLAQEQIVLAPNPPPEGAETLTLPYAGGSIGATRVRTSAAPRPLILFCGGNMFRRSSAGGSAARKLEPFGDVLMFDYPGYGETGGEADFAHFSTAGEVMAATARAQADAEGRPLIAWGHSLGGVVCTDAAVKARADALVLETTTPGARAAVEQQAGMMRPFLRITLAPALASIDVPAALDGFAIPGPVRTVGYCMGGRCALMLAGFHPDRVVAAASFHGGELAVEHDHSPHHLAGRIKGRIYIGVAETDAFFEAEEEGRLMAALRGGGVNHILETYPGTHHGFAVPDLPVHQPEAAEEHYQRLFWVFASC